MSPANPPLPDDIEARIAADFPAGTEQRQVREALAVLEVNEKARVSRCILFCAAGELARFAEMLALARLDYRDVIMAGEYEYPSCRRVRDFTLPFTGTAPPA